MILYGTFFKIISALAPTVLKTHGIGLSKRVTSYPSVKDTMVDGNQYTYVDDEKVVVDGNLITSRVMSIFTSSLDLS